MKTFYQIIVIVCILVGAFVVGRHTKRYPIHDVRIDTLIVRDTIRDTIPVERTRYVTRVERDTVLVIQYDTVAQTFYVNVPIEKTQYKSDTYDVWIEGYKSRMLSIDVYRETFYVDRIERVKTKPRWGLGVQVGYGTDFKHVAPYVGVGVQYNILTW